MEQITVVFQRQDGAAERTEKILLDAKFGDFREAAQTLLGLPDNPPCRIILGGTGRELRDNITPREAGLKENSRLTFIPSGALGSNNGSPSSGRVSSGVGDSSSTYSPPKTTYSLELTLVSGDGQVWKYPIDLERFYEDSPDRFFTDSNGRERKRFTDSLQQVLPRDIKSVEIERILRAWCQDIAEGYRNTHFKI